MGEELEGSELPTGGSSSLSKVKHLDMARTAYVARLTYPQRMFLLFTESFLVELDCTPCYRCIFSRIHRLLLSENKSLQVVLVLRERRAAFLSFSMMLY